MDESHRADDAASSLALEPLDSLARQITELAAHIHAATYRLLVLIAELDRREAWAHEGILSTAHWLNWRCGIGLVAARETVRVANALERLPQISEAFRGGKVSYSKVRAMARVATPENESYLLHLARHGTAAHVERLTRAYRQVQRNAETEHANAVHESRSLYYHHDEDGTFVVSIRLAPEAGALFVKALDAAGEAQYRQARENDSAESSAHAGIESLNRAAGLDIDADTCTSLWDGTHMDYNTAICALLADDARGGD